jgi:hypothetical protein
MEREIGGRRETGLLSVFPPEIPHVTIRFLLHRRKQQIRVCVTGSIAAACSLHQRGVVRACHAWPRVESRLLAQEGICMTLEPDFKFLEVAFPYIAKRLLTDEDPILRERLLQVRESS